MNDKTEHLHQVTLISWFDRTYIELSGRLFAIPNGGLRAKSVAAKLSIEGVRKGVPDLFLPVSRSGFYGLFIELKSEKGRPTKEQNDWVLFLLAQGYMAKVCYGYQEAIDLISGYMKGT